VSVYEEDIIIADGSQNRF